MDISAIAAAATQSADAGFVHKGRVLQADADFYCYKAANLDMPISSNIETLHKIVRDRKKAACAEFVNVHVTIGLKSGRNEIATVKAYQEQRERDPALSQRVRELRHYFANYKGGEFQAVADPQQEADDTLTQYQLRRIEQFGILSTVIESGDKDLWMVEGMHIDPDTDRMYRVQGYGSTEYREVGNVKPKLVGEGTSWFWHQLIMGDKADNIPGLPMLSGRLANVYLPLKKHNPKRTALACGEAKAVAILDGVDNDQIALRRVYEAYQDHYGNKAMEMFVEQAYLLWMRRTTNVMDVILFLRDCGLTRCEFSEQQKTNLRRFGENIKLMQQQAKLQ